MVRNSKASQRTREVLISRTILYVWLKKLSVRGMSAGFAADGMIGVFANSGPSRLFVSPSLSSRLFALSAAQNSAQPLKRLRDEDFCTMQQVSN